MARKGGTTNQERQFYPPSSPPPSLPFPARVCTDCLPFPHLPTTLGFSYEAVSTTTSLGTHGVTFQEEKDNKQIPTYRESEG